MITIDGRVFDHKRGVILSPEPDAIPFRASTSTGTGVQVTAARGPAFTLTLTMFDEVAQHIVNQQWIASRIGRQVRIIDYIENTPVDYLRPIFGSLVFRATQARTIEAAIVSGWCGFRFNQTQLSFYPASKLVCQFTLYAVQV